MWKLSGTRSTGCVLLSLNFVQWMWEKFSMKRTLSDSDYAVKIMLAQLLSEINRESDFFLPQNRKLFCSVLTKINAVYVFWNPEDHSLDMDPLQNRCHQTPPPLPPKWLLFCLPLTLYLDLFCLHWRFREGLIGPWSFLFHVVTRYASWLN